MTTLVNRFDTVEDLLDDARSRLLRVTPLAAAALVDHGALIVDIRPAWQRAETGEVPGSLIVERNHLEWRLHPGSSSRVAQARPAQQWIVLCAEGYTSSLAADALNSLGVPATDVVGGVEAWRAAGLPLVPGPTPVEQVVS
ncbi:MAG TPA: rhodanese-like domain-containing protein [Jatrophihabitantaceae bacterium]|jgi:rhodanese-related sulfurtransferase